MIRNRGNVVLVIVILALIGAILFQCEREKHLNDTIRALNSSVKTYKLKNGSLVKTLNTETYTSSQLKENLLNKDKKIKEISKRFSSIKSVTLTNTITKIDTIFIDIEKKTPVFNENFTFKYLIDKNNLKIIDLKIADSLIIITGSKRKWFLGRSTTTIDVSHSNPLVNTIGLRHLEVKNHKKFYDTRIFNIGAGFIFGVWLLK